MSGKKLAVPSAKTRKSGNLVTFNTYEPREDRDSRSDMSMSRGVFDKDRGSFGLSGGTSLRWKG